MATPRAVKGANPRGTKEADALLELSCRTSSSLSIHQSSEATVPISAAVRICTDMAPNIDPRSANVFSHADASSYPEMIIKSMLARLPTLS